METVRNAARLAVYVAIITTLNSDQKVTRILDEMEYGSIAPPTTREPIWLVIHGYYMVVIHYRVMVALRSGCELSFRFSIGGSVWVRIPSSDIMIIINFTSELFWKQKKAGTNNSLKQYNILVLITLDSWIYDFLWTWKKVSEMWRASPLPAPPPITRVYQEWIS